MKSDTVCSCGLDSAEECERIFHSILLKDFSDFSCAKVHRLTVDAYSLQHPDVYMISSKSFAAHLTGICCAMEYGNDPELFRLLQKWLNRKKQIPRPENLENFGNLTIAHVSQAKSGPEHVDLVWEWARDVWEAYRPYRGLAMKWIESVKQNSSDD